MKINSKMKLHFMPISMDKTKQNKTVTTEKWYHKGEEMESFINTTLQHVGVPMHIYLREKKTSVPWQICSEQLYSHPLTLDAREIIGWMLF